MDPSTQPVYAAPEVVEEKSYGAAVDMWSLGVIVYILVTGAMPRDLWKSALKYGRVAEADFGFDCYEWDTVSEAARDFVRRCLTHDPKRRLSAADALEHPWMKKVSNVRPAPLRIKSQLRDFAKEQKLHDKLQIMLGTAHIKVSEGNQKEKKALEKKRKLEEKRKQKLEKDELKRMERTRVPGLAAGKAAPPPPIPNPGAASGAQGTSS